MERIGRYFIIEKIGAGGMAEVFLARAQGAFNTEKLLVLKKIHPALATNKKFIDMFVDEAHVAMRLNHSNVVQVYAFEQIEGANILAMEFVDGWDLQGILTSIRQAGKRLPFGIAAYIAGEVAKGLDYAHSRKDDRGAKLDIVHRDVSPQNILISRDGAVKIADFGIARAKWAQEEVGVVKGKLGYMSPEQGQGLAVDRTSDVFSLGIVLGEMLTGKPPAARLPQLTAEEHKANLVSVKQLDPSIPDSLDAIVSKAIAFDPKERYATTRLLARDLGLFLHSQNEFCDSQVFEEWISANVSTLKSKSPEAIAAELATTSATLLAETSGGLVEGSSVAKDATIQMRRPLGELEPRMVILVSTEVTIDESDTRSPVYAEIDRLVGEIAYKSSGVVQRQGQVIRIFVGMWKSSITDAITGIRIASDIVDAARGLARDRVVSIGVKVAINRGYVQLKSINDQESTFESAEKLLQVSHALLQETQTNEILVGSTVFDLTKKDYGFGDAREIVIESTGDGEETKNWVRGYPVDRALSRKERSLAKQDRGIFVGRSAEIATLKAVYKRALSSKSQILKVVGEMGIGKSLLVQQFIGRWVKKKTGIVEAECLFAERDEPLAVVVATIRNLLGFSEGESLANLEEKLRPFIGEAPSYLERQVSQLTALLQNRDRTWLKAGSKKRDLVRRIAFGLGVLISLKSKGHGAVIVIENAHWMDGPSVDVLSELASLQTKDSVFVLLVGQSQTLAHRKIQGMETLAVGELSEKQIKKIIQHRLGVTQGMGAIIRDIVSHANGNPFFTNEILDSIIDRGIIQAVSNKEFKAEGLKYKLVKKVGFRLPTTMEGLAASQLDTLESGLRKTLRVASVIGTFFTLPDLNSLSADPSDKAVERLVDLGFLAKVPQEDKEDLYRFKKPMVREAAYSGISTQEKTRIHLNLAEDLIKQLEQNKGIPPSRIAWHLKKGGERARAGKYYLMGGDEAMDIYSTRSALRHFNQALEVLPRGSELSYNALLKKERALNDLGKHKERENTILEMESIGVLLNDLNKQTVASNMLAKVKFDLGDYAQATSATSRSIELAQKTNNVFVQIDSLILLSDLAVEEGSLSKALDCCNWAQSLCPPGQEGLILAAKVASAKGLVLLCMGKTNQAPQYLARALVLFDHLGRKRHVSEVLGILSSLAQARGDLLESADFLERAIMLDKKIKDGSARGRKRALLGSIRVELGAFVEGQLDLEEGLKICKDNIEPAGEVDAELGLANLWLTKGDAVGAKEILREVWRKGFVFKSRWLLTRQYQLYSEAQLAVGKIDSATRAAAKAEQIAKETQMMGEVVHGSVRLGIALSKKGDPHQAVTVTDCIDGIIADLDKVRNVEEAWWLRGNILRAAQKHQQAQIAFENAQKEVARKLGLIKEARYRKTFLAHPLIVKIQNAATI